MQSFLNLLVFLLMMAFLSNDALAVYWIDEINQEPENYQLTKADKTSVPVTIYKTLEHGDCIEVIGVKAKLWIASDSSPKEMLSRDGVSNKCIKEEKPASIRSSSLTEWAGRWLTNRIHATTSRTVVSLITRGEEGKGITIPLATQGGLRMVSGRRSLYISWQGGKQPFSVRMASEGSLKTVFERRNITDRQLEVDSVFLNEGIYHVEISDAMGMTAQNLHVVSPGEMPFPRLESYGSASSRDQLAVVGAVRLASQGNGWAFEAYQTAADLAPRYQPAKILQKSLENGDIPLPMPE
ncbi:hypothetical protein [Methylobacter sp. YRD-M1]|uniref:hypothetical protein n=1 Tax=Methylobacter sp. YRD-M1 TaxID=2911520 RepID=UPI00227D65BF|nr:hypothetical protein [Methylobacter sp. YRD-M1]WAK00537.1 hypothetical protein LZ558_11805 [Methylobacter sp. YRD-M1]